MSTATAATPKPPSAHVDDQAAENIPAELRVETRWLVWKWEWKPASGNAKAKWDKPPINPETGDEFDATDPAGWLQCDKARGTAHKHGDGPGFALGTKDDPSGFVVLDVDHCIDPAGSIDPRALELVERFNTYAEITPSRKGIRIWLRGKKPGDKCRRPSHQDKFLATIEIYEHGRYLTVTGKKLEIAPSAIATRHTALDDVYGAMFGTGGNHPGNGQPHACSPVDVSDEALLAKARKATHGAEFSALYDRGDTGSHGGDDSSADLSLLNRLAFWTGCDTGRMETLFSASALGQREKWKSRPDYRARSIDKAIRDCTATYEPKPKPGAKPSSNSKSMKTNGSATNEAVDDPHRLARLFLSQQARVVYHQAEFHLWENSAYSPFPDHEVNAITNTIAKQEFDRLNPIEVKAWEDRGMIDELTGKPCRKPITRKVGTRLIGDIALAIRGETLLSGRIEPPAWLIDNPPFPATDVLPTLNALVHLPSYVEGKPRAIVKPTPDFFCPYALDYGFDAKAPEPHQLALFLSSVWPKDGESFLALQEWLGYLLTPDKSQHKMALLIGPPRSGRGTICRLIKKLIGASNVANPTLSGLATQFGAECLIGKPVAIIGDARQSNRGDWAVALERILGITGDDSMTIDRKNKFAWTGSLTTRLILVSNELPKFPDQSGAIATRPLVFKFTESFLGREDKTLDAKLEAELPSILLWAIEGWKRLRERGGFLQPSAGKDLIDQMRDLASPVGAFVRERCEVKAGNRIARKELFQAWKNWCADRNREAGNDATFGRNLRAVCPYLGETQPRDEYGVQYRAYEGIKLLP